MILGLFTTGISIALAPNFHEVIPGFVILRVLMTAGIIPGGTAPLLPDYIYPKSLGIANAYQSVISGLSSIVATPVIFAISKQVSLYWIFTGMGTFCILVGILMIFGVRDILMMRKKQIKEKLIIKIV